MSIRDFFRKMFAPPVPDHVRQRASETSEAIRKWCQKQAKAWWSQQDGDRAKCDACNIDIFRSEGYLLANWLRCDNCIDRALSDADWPQLLSGESREQIAQRLVRHFGPLSQQILRLATRREATR